MEQPKYRYIRTSLTLKHPRFSDCTEEEIIKKLSSSFNSPITSVPGLNNFYRVSASVPLVNNNLYQEGFIFGVDASSGIAVLNLEIEKYNQVLDMCCAPGAKLLFIAEILKNLGSIKSNTDEMNKRGMVTGFDISKKRLGIVRNLLKKYKLLDSVILHNKDATKSPYIMPLSKNNYEIGDNIIEISPFYAPKVIRNKCVATNDSTQHGFYDRVLVDAECTHDGSIIHCIKKETVKWKIVSTNDQQNKELNNLYSTQLNLINTAYRYLKRNGILVYCTCSLSFEQNENVIKNFLDNFKDQELKPQKLEIGHIPKNTHVVKIDQTELENMFVDMNTYQLDIVSSAIRFTNNKSNMSGLFIIKIKKP